MTKFLKIVCHVKARDEKQNTCNILYFEIPISKKSKCFLRHLTCYNLYAVLDTSEIYTSFEIINALLQIRYRIVLCLYYVYL